MIKRNTTALIFALALLLAASPETSFATKGEGGGGVAGNGGDVIYCEHPLPGQKRIELLDLYESRILRDNVIALGDAGWDYNRRITYVLDRLKRLDAYRAQTYADVASRFIENSEFTSDELPDIPDSMHVALPKGCVIRQIVIQREGWSYEKHFLVNSPLWEMLDEENRAALVLHETIYWEALSLKQSNSINTRLFNGTLTSTALETMNLTTYLDLLKKVGFRFQRSILDDGNWFNLPEKENIDYQLSCQIVGARFFGHELNGCLEYEIADNKFYLKRFVGKNIWARPNSSSDGARFSWPVDGKANGQMLEFYAVTVGHDLRVLRGELVNDMYRKSAHYDLKCKTYSKFSFNDGQDDDECAIFEYDPFSTIEVQGRQVKILPPGEYGYTVTIDRKLDRVTYARFFQPEQFLIRSKTLTFVGEFKTSNNGNISTGFLNEPGDLQIPHSSRYIEAAKESQIFLYEDGTVLQAKLESGAYLKKDDGRRAFFSSGAWVRFNELGEVIVKQGN